MSSKIDTPLDNLVKSNRVKNKGRGVGRAQKMVNSSRQNRAGRGRGRGIASKFTGGVRGGSTNITARLGFTTKLKSTQNGVKTKNVQKVSDLRDVLATKTKTTVADLRAKLPQKPPVKNEKKKIPAPPAPRSRSPLRISSDMFRSSTRPRGGGSSHSKEAIFSKSSREAERTLSRRLPTTAEAKKITVTVQGLSKTTSEAYRKEERLAAVIARQKDSRQQNFMRSREEFIASSITSAISGDVRGNVGMSNDIGRGGGMSHHRYRSPSPVFADYQQYDPPPLPPPPMVMGPQSRHRGQGITSVTTLIISNLNDTVSHSDVHELCTAIGPVDNVTMTAPGVTEVTFRYKDDALEAYKKYNQRNLDGMPMMCRLQPGPSRVRPLPPPPPHQINSYSRIPEPFLPDTSIYGGHGSYY